MQVLLLFILFILCFSIIILLKNYNNDKTNFQKKIGLLEALINELNANLIAQNQKVKLSDDFKQKIKESNHTLSNSIFEMNIGLFEELYPKKK